MKRRIKPFPIIILLLLASLGAVWYFGLIPNWSAIKENFKDTEVVYLENTTWTIYESPYRIDQHIIVEEGVQLTVAPGVQVIFSNNASLTIYGHLQARGSKDNPILFTGEENSPGSWEGIIFTAYCGKENAYEREHPVLQHCIIRDARQAVRSEGCQVDVLNCWFENNEKGIEVNQSANIRIRNNAFVDCKEALRIHQEVTLSNLDLTEVSGNEFENCQSVLLEGSVDFGFNYLHNFDSEYGAVIIAPRDSHRILFHHNRLTNLTRAVEIESLNKAAVDIKQNCFDNNDIHLYMACTNSGEASLNISENNFLKFNQFSLKALEGCADEEPEKVSISSNYWGTNDKSKILNSLWNYSSSSSIRLINYRFIPFPCFWEDHEADSEAAVLPTSSIETFEERMDDVNTTLREKLDSIKRNFEDIINSTNSKIETNHIMIEGIEMDSLFQELNKKLAGGKSIEITIDDEGNIVTNEFENLPEAVPPKKPASVDCVLPELPGDDVYVVTDQLSDKDPNVSSHIFICSNAKYYTHFKNRKPRTLYVSKNGYAGLLNTGNHTIYVDAGGSLRVGGSSKGNTIYYHPLAKLSGTLSSENVIKSIECPGLDFTILFESSFNQCGK